MLVPLEGDIEGQETYGYDNEEEMLQQQQQFKQLQQQQQQQYDQGLYGNEFRIEEQQEINEQDSENYGQGEGEGSQRNNQSNQQQVYDEDEFQMNSQKYDGAIPSDSYKKG